MSTRQRIYEPFVLHFLILFLTPALRFCMCCSSCKNVSKIRVSKMFAEARMSKNKAIALALRFSSKRVKNQCSDTLDFNGSRDLANPAQQGQIVSSRSKDVRKRWTCNRTPHFWRVSKRVTTCQQALARPDVSNRVERMSNMFQRVSKNVTKRDQKVRGSAFRVKTFQTSVYFSHASEDSDSDSRH